MNAAELIGHETARELLKETLISFFKGKLNANVMALDPILRVEAFPFKIKNTGLLRINTDNQTSALCVGFSDPAQFDAYGRLIDSSWKEVTSSARKSADMQLLNALSTALHSFFNQNGLDYNPKSCIALSAASLGIWSQMEIVKSIQIPFTINDAKLVFEFPCFDSAQRQKIVMDNYGLAEESKILVVDDSPTTRKLSRFHLNSVGFIHLDECEDGLVAIQKLEANPGEFQLVVADWHMPNLTGLDLLKKIRAHAQLANLPVVLVTGERNKDEVFKAIREGVSAYVVKPYEPEVLFKAIKVGTEKKVKKAA